MKQRVTCHVVVDGECVGVRKELRQVWTIKGVKYVRVDGKNIRLKLGLHYDFCIRG